MCDVCADILEILESRDVRNSDKSGSLLTKKEITSIIHYTQLWPQQRQCMCCYADIKNFSRFNNVIQLMLAQAIQFIETLTREAKVVTSSSTTTEEDEVDVTSLETSKSSSRELMEGMSTDDSMDGRRNSSPDSKETWSLEEKDRLFQFVIKVFSPGFPLYLAFKHRVPTTLEELAKHDTSVLNTYCELNDPDVPLLLLRNVCYFCDSNGFKALAQCFRDSQPDTLPLSVAQTLVSICANVRMWMNYRAAARFMNMIRRQIIGYMCHFTEKDLRTTMARTMTELVWQALKDSRDLTSQTCLVTFDKEGLDLAFKYFTCSMLTLRLAGIAQINTQINMYTELAQGEGMAEVESVGSQLSDWLIENKIIEQIFGPNLHVEIIKQSQVILNFLALECRFTNDHVDVIWGASQLKHCGKQVLDILSMMVKNMDLIPAQHLHGLMQQLEPSAHTEQTLMLASALTKLLWMNNLTPQNHQTLTLVARHHGNQAQVFAVAAQQMSEDADLVNGVNFLMTGELLKQAQFGSSRSDSDDEEEEEEDDDEDADASGNELEMGEVKQLRHPLQHHHHFSSHHLQHHRIPHLMLAASSPLKECWNESLHHAKLPGHSQGPMVRNRRFKSSSTDGQRSEPKSDDEDEDDNQSEEEERVSRNVGKHRKSNNKKLPLKMVGLQHQGNRDQSFKRLKHSARRKQRQEEEDDEDDDNENEGGKNRIVKMSEGRKMDNSKSSPFKKKFRLLHDGLSAGRVLFKPKLSRNQVKYKLKGRQVSDDEEGKKESDDENNDGGDLSDSEVDMSSIACKENKSSDEDDGAEDETGGAENDEEKEKSPSASPSSSSSGSVSTCDEERKNKRRFSNKICLTNSPQDFQGSISVGRPIAGKSRRALMMAMRLKNQKKNFVNLMAKTDNSEKIGRGVKDKHPPLKKAEIAGKGLNKGSLVTHDANNILHDFGDGDTINKDLPEAQKHENKMSYLQQQLNQHSEKPTGDSSPRVHTYQQQEEKSNVNDENHLQTTQPVVIDSSICNQQGRSGDSASEERLMVLPTCRDDDVAMVTDAMLMEAYSVKDGGRMMQFDDEGNKAITAEDLEACLDSSGNEPGVILIKSNQSMPGNLVEDILSPEGTSNSSRFTNKSEKNMSDFEGEDAISDEELANINAHSPFVGLHPLQPQLATIAPFYHHPHHHHHHHHHLHAHSHLQEVFHETQVSLGPRDVGEAKLNELCQPQNTIIWDLLQDHNIDKLQEGLASEAEKILSSLICLTSDKKMKSKFIEACISNLAQNKSVVISLRLLSKLLNSFNQYRSGPNTHYMTLWADSELSMLKHFFNNLVHYTKAFKEDTKMHNIFSHKEEVQSRLQFLTCVFSSNGSPEGFRLNMEQMDILWDCLAYDPQCSDDCLQWFYNQTKNKDYHALKMDTLRHIFVEKMPLLKAEETSMIGLNLFTQLCHLAHSASGDSSHSDDQNYGIDQLWEIALRARNTDVSLNAISVLNHHYISIGGGALDKEESFVQKCMKSLMVASGDLYQNAESSLLVIQRALILLTNHLESFRKQHAYHLRLCQLNNQMVQSHYNVGKNLPPSLSYPHKIRIIFQTAGSNARTAIEMSPNDLVAELRAEINHWWETMHNKNTQQHSDKCDAAVGKCGSANPSIVYGGVRLITQGQELSPQVDDKTLAEMQFKDHQLVFVSQSGGRSKRVDSQQLMNSLYKLPMILLTEEPHFTCLFNLLHQLSSFSPNNFDGDLQEHCSLQTKARVLSRKVWSLLMLLPTNKKMFEAFFGIADESAHQTTKTAWRELLEPANAHKLMYSLLIVESLSRPNKSKSKSYKVSGANVQSNDDASESCPEKQWKNKFVACGGFQHLLSILLSGVLQDQDGSKQDEWQNDCLACLLRLINLFAISNCDLETYHSELFDMLESPMKKMSKRRPSEKMVVPCINEHLSSQMDVEALTKVLMVTMFNAAMPSREFDRLPVTSWGHVDVVRCSMSLLVSLAFSFPSVLSMFATSEKFPSWLKRMTLEALEPSIRQESCQGLYRLCLGKTSDGQTGYKYLILTFNNLLPCLADACSLKPAKKSPPGLSASFGKSHDDKEPYGPGCRDYLWLMCQLVDGIKKEDAEKSWNQAEVAGGSQTDADDSKACIEKTQLADLSEVGRAVAARIVGRGYFEKRHNTVDDDGLVGLLKFCQCLLKHNPPFKISTDGQTFLVDIFQCLFALPSPTARFLPKCKSQSSRNAAFDLLIEMVKGNIESYIILHSLLMKQNHKDSHMPYSWDAWPHDEERSKCGYVGLTNLGATCYMATCMQHLFMIPEARRVILDAKCLDSTNHAGILIELKKMFAYLLESERKAYNPYSFCKVYTMDHQPLNTGEQKDMTEFFTDLITKLEEMGPDMKSMVKSLFGGVLTNNVVSLDCPHVSRTKEEFYTVRCQVADMKNLNESLDEVTVKDMLEGDNMYTCSKCQKKVRAEKRACFCKLPSILCFNTMRYTFNMITMMKEKVNTHFSFPLKLDMSPYMETNLISRQCSSSEDRERLSTSELDDASQTSESPTNQDENAEEQSNETGFEYELIGVTVHTGTADAGHYYSFIRDRANKTDIGQDRWYLFNDAEVKPFDPAQLASECFGGETTSKTYDSVTDKFMDFSFEKTHSAYMLFYERINNTNPCSSATPLKVKDPLITSPMLPPFRASSRSDDVVTPFGSTDEDEQLRSKYELPPDLAEWIWQDNTQFLQDKSIFEHSYFSFMMQMCNSVPATLPRNNPSIQIPLLATKLSTSFILETLIHAKEKPTMLQFIENTTKLFNSDRRCCEWFLDTMTEDDWWPQQILIRCPNQTVRQMFQRLVIHVINQLKPVHNKSEEEPDVSCNTSGAVDDSCVNRFIRKMLGIIEQDSRLHCRYLAEYFGFLLEFAKIRDNECRFLNQINTITILVGFFMSHKQQGDYTTSNEMSDDDDERDFEDIINLSDDKYCPQALEKMISLVALLVEKSRVDHKNLHLSDKDTHALLGGRGLPFLYHQIRDAINLRQTCNLIFSLSRFNERLASNIIQMILHSLTRTGTETQPFFKLLSMLVEFVGGPPGMPLFLQHILVKFWEVAEYCPQPALEWLSTQVMRNKMAMTWVLQTMDAWVEMYLMSYSNVRVRNCAAHLLVALVPSNTFRQTFKTNRSMLTSHKEPIAMSEEAVEVVHEVYGHLLKLLCKARQYVDGQGHGTSKLVPYFSVLNYCLISKTEKLMFSRYFNDLWLLFQPKLSEPQIAVNHNKQAMLIFWYHVCLDCPENIKLIVSNPSISKNIAFNYILADHEDQEVIMTNRTTLPAYYGILRMCCMQSPAFTRYLAAHQNIQWAFRNITTHPTQYTAAVDELYWLMRLMVAITPGMSEEDVKAVVQFRRNTIQLYLQILDARSQWQTLVSVFRILLDRHEERIFVLQNNGIILMYEAFTTLHLMHYEATACHVAEDINHLLGIISQMLASARKHLPEKKGSDVKPHLTAWKDRGEFMKKLLSLLNFYTPPEMRQATFACLREMILTYQFEWIQTIVPMLVQAHASFQATNEPVSMGPYFPRPGQKAGLAKSNLRTPRPQFQMFLHASQVESKKGVDSSYDAALYEAFDPYHHLVDLLLRVAVNHQNLPDAIVRLSAMVAYEGAPLHLPYFAKLWYEIYQTESVDRKWVDVLCSCPSFIEYIDSVLTNERASLNNLHIYQFFCNFFPKVHTKVLTNQNPDLMASIISSIESSSLPSENDPMTPREMERMWTNINGDLKALQITLSVQESKKVPPSLIECFKCFQQQFFRALQFYQASSGHQPSTSTRQVPASKLPLVAGTRTTVDDQASPSSTPKLLQNIITGKGPSKRRRLGSKGELEELFMSPNSNKSSNLDSDVSSRTKNSGNKRGHDDDDDSEAEEYSYVTNSALDTSVEEKKGTSLSSSRDDQPSTSKSFPASSTSLDQGVLIKDDDDMDVSDDNDDDDDNRSEDDGSGDKKSFLHADKPQTSYCLATKDKPSLVDSVVKNVDAVFRLILDKVNGKDQ